MSMAELLDTDLGVNPLRLTGRSSRLPTVLGERALEPDEVRARMSREAGTKPRPLERVTARHRQLARAIAAGTGPGAAARAVGLTASRVSILLQDETFIELVNHCKQEQDRAFQGFNEVLAGIGEEAASILRERLETDADAFDNGELESIIKTTADRTGYGPKRVEEKTINLNFGDKLAAARSRALTVERVIEGEVIPDAEVVE